MKAIWNLFLKTYFSQRLNVFNGISVLVQKKNAGYRKFPSPRQF